MDVMMVNGEGYSDPTADVAVGRVMREQKRKAKTQRRREINPENYRDAKKVYVISPYAGNTKANAANAVRYCRYVIRKGNMPIASHLMYPMILNDKNPKERELGQMFGLALLAMCDEAWVFGSCISLGMETEIAEAGRLEIPIRYFRCEATFD